MKMESCKSFPSICLRCETPRSSLFVQMWENSLIDSDCKTRADEKEQTSIEYIIQCRTTLHVTFLMFILPMAWIKCCGDAKKKYSEPSQAQCWISRAHGLIYFNFFGPRNYVWMSNCESKHWTISKVLNVRNSILVSVFSGHSHRGAGRQIDIYFFHPVWPFSTLFFWFRTVSQIKMFDSFQKTLQQ